MFKKIKLKLHKFLFPGFHKDWSRIPFLNETIDSMSRRYREFQLDKVSIENKKEPAISDLTKKFLDGYNIDFFNVEIHDDPEKSGYPRHFLNIDDKDKHTMYIGQLAQIHSLEVWKEMLQYHINTQGNRSPS